MSEIALAKHSNIAEFVNCRAISQRLMGERVAERLIAELLHYE